MTEVTKLKAPANLKGVLKEVPNEAVADWLAAGWINPTARKPKAKPEAEINSPETVENLTNKDDK